MTPYNRHLLGKKSWNVYNPENIARVKRDEAQAKAREEEDERLMQEVDAERRIKILRGERPPTPPPAPGPSQQSTEHSERKLQDGSRQDRKRRRLMGEDDTDRDIRLAREDAQNAASVRDGQSRSSRKDDKVNQAPIVDDRGHINLFPGDSKQAEKNAEAEAERKKKERSFEDQYTMRFSNAAGFKEQAGRQPWYSSSAQMVTAPDAMPDKNVWGNEDPMRREREKARMDVNDPLAAMKRGVRQLKTTQEERKRWREEKRKEIESLETAENHSSRHYRKRSHSTNSLDDFRLDNSASKERGYKGHRSSHHRHRHRHRHDHDRDHNRDRSRHRSRDRSYRRHRESSDRSHHHHRADDRQSRRHSRPESRSISAKS